MTAPFHMPGDPNTVVTARNQQEMDLALFCMTAAQFLTALDRWISTGAPSGALDHTFQKFLEYGCAQYGNGSKLRMDTLEVFARLGYDLHVHISPEVAQA